MDEFCFSIHLLLNTDITQPDPALSSSSYNASPLEQNHDDVISMSVQTINTSEKTQDEPYISQESSSFLKIQFLLESVLIPGLCILGVLGNIFNIIVFVRRRLQIVMDTMEKGAICGLIAIAVSDLMFCALTALKSVLPGGSIVYTSRNLSFYFELYGVGLQNILIKTSTWLTVITTAARYAAICHPFKARYTLKLKYTRFSIVLTFSFWTLLHLPMFWTYEVQTLDCGDTRYYWLDVGVFTTNNTLRNVFTYLWGFLGFFLPVIMMVYCNICLIITLRESAKLRAESGHHRSTVHPSKINRRITLTLIAVVIAFIILVSPSEILHFYVDASTSSPPNPDAFALALQVTNVLQAINFSFNFLLYCLINCHFRKTIVDIILVVMNFRQRSRASSYRRKRFTLSVSFRSLMSQQSNQDVKSKSRSNDSPMVMPEHIMDPKKPVAFV